MHRARPFLCGLVLFSCSLEGVGQGTHAVMEPDAELSGRRTFFDFPWPSDLRRADDGTVELDGWPAPTGNAIVASFKRAAKGKAGFPVLPVAYFRFTGPLEQRDTPTPFAPELASDVLLVDLDAPAGPRLLPTVAVTPNPDAFTPENLLAVAPRPGVVLVPGRRYAFAVLRSLGDAEGKTLGLPPLLAQLMQGQAPQGARAAQLPALYAPLFAALERLGLPRAKLAAATVFTPGDEVAATADLAEKLRAKYHPDIEVLGLESDPRFDAAPFCHLQGRITLPQFQTGTPTFVEGGLFDAPGPDGLPPRLRDEVALVSLGIPRRAMPEAGYPLVLYFHGSGGRAREFADGAESGATAPPISVWPGTTLAARGFAVAGQSLPVSPDRVLGASDIAYLNLQNPVALRDTFRQGIIESRLFLDALERLRLPAAALAACAGASLPVGETHYRFSLQRLSVQGQSMGGMYTNMVSAIEPRIEAAVPTGAGGLWSLFALVTPQIPPPNENLLGQVLGASARPLSFLHPGLQLLELVWEPVDPLVSMPRLSRRPLPGHPARAVYEPVSENDSFFPTEIYDAMVLGYGHPLAGEEIWPGARAGLASLGLEPTATYPVKDNLTSDDGRPYTGVAVQHANDGGFDGHGVYRRLESVKWQYGCFHETFQQDGVAVVPPPAPASGPCPR